MCCSILYYHVKYLYLVDQTYNLGGSVTTQFYIFYLNMFLVNLNITTFIFIPSKILL